VQRSDWAAAGAEPAAAQRAITPKASASVLEDLPFGFIRVPSKIHIADEMISRGDFTLENNLGKEGSVRLGNCLRARLHAGDPGRVRSDCRYGFGEGRGHDLDDQIASIFQLISCRCGLGLITDDGHAGFVGPSRVPVEDRQTHLETFPRPPVEPEPTRTIDCSKARKIPSGRVLPLICLETGKEKRPASLPAVAVSNSG